MTHFERFAIGVGIVSMIYLGYELFRIWQGRNTYLNHLSGDEHDDNR